MYVNHLQDDWICKLSITEFIYNNNMHISIKITSFFIFTETYLLIKKKIKLSVCNISAVYK